MIDIIRTDRVEEVKNEGLRKDIELYAGIYDNFMLELVQVGMSIANDEEDGVEETAKIKEELRTLGVQERNNGKSWLWGENISPSCVECRTGDGSATYIISLKCNRDCFFCTNKNQYDYTYHNDRVNDVKGQFNNTSKHYAEMKSAALTGGEPLLFMDECISFIKHVKKRNKKTQTRIYTNGDLASEENLKRLADAGLDEIRFGLKPDEDGTVPEALYKNLENAVKYIPRAMVEMPAEKGKLEEMKAIFDRLESIGIFGINILEFLFPWVHVKEYVAKGHKVKKYPYTILYDYDYAGGVSVAGSELECLQLVKYAAEKKFKMGVHYCSLENKLTAQVWHHNKRVDLSDYEYLSPNDFYIKTAKAYGDDAHKVKETLDEAGRGRYMYNKSDAKIEFSVKDIELLKGKNIDIGISSMILDRDEKQTFIREVAVHKANSDNFSLDDI